MMDFDSILDHLGHFGKFQLYVMLLAGVCQIFGGMHLKAGRFLNPMVKPNLHLQRCYIPNCDNSSSNYSESFVHFAIPPVFQDGRVSLSQCERYEQIPGSHSCSPDHFTNSTVACEKFIYDHHVFEETAISEFDIVCKKSWSGASSQSTFMGGVLLGSFLFGTLADRFGRKKVILTATMMMLCSSIGTAFSPNFTIFTVLRFFTAMAVCGLFQTGYIVAVEFVGSSKRLWCANIMQIVFAVGELVLGLVAYLVRQWKVLELLISVPAALLLGYYWLLPESVRWQISKGKFEEAKKTIDKAARWNTKVVPDHLLRSASYAPHPDTDIESEHRQTSSSSPMTLFRTPQLRKWSFNIFLNWIVNAMVYYGLSLSAANLSGNAYLNFAILSAVEIPAVLLVTVALSYCGRRWVLCLTMIFGGFACGATVFIPQSLGWISTMMAVLGKSAIAASFAVIYIYSVEIYPTVVRSTGIGMSSMFSRLGAIIAPIINELRKVYRPLPMIIFAIASIVAGLMALLLPETHNQQLPETVEETERFGISRVNDILNVPRSRLLGRFGNSVTSHRDMIRRSVEERRHLMSEDA